MAQRLKELSEMKWEPEPQEDEKILFAAFEGPILDAIKALGNFDASSPSAANTTAEGLGLKTGIQVSL
jgi:hypothetical protein